MKRCRRTWLNRSSPTRRRSITTTRSDGTASSAERGEDLPRVVDVAVNLGDEVGDGREALLGSQTLDKLDLAPLIVEVALKIQDVDFDRPADAGEGRPSANVRRT